MRRGRGAAVALALTGALLALAGARASAGPGEPPAPREVHPTSATRALRPHAGPGPAFAIVAFDSAAGAWGAACASSSVACGARIPAARAGAGAAVVLGAPTDAPARAALALLERAGSADIAIDSVRALPGDAEAIQVAAVDAHGRAEAATGRRVRGWSGQRLGQGFVCVAQGLDGSEALQAMAAAFEGAAGDLSGRLLAALTAAAWSIDPDGAFEEAEGDASAALLVVRAGSEPAGPGSDRIADLRVDAADDPIRALERVYERFQGTYLAAEHVRFGDRAKRAGDEAAARREYDLAEAGFRAAIGRRPKDPDALNELAWFLATHGGDPAEAVRHAEAAIQARGDDPNLYDTLAEAAYRAGDLERAIEAAGRAAKLARGNARYAERLRAFEAAKAALTKQPPAAPADSSKRVAPSR